MKKGLLIIVVASTVFGSYLVTSCMAPKSDVAPATAEISYRQDTLSGVKVLIPNGVSKSVFYAIAVTRSDAKARAAASILSLAELAEIAKPIVEKYPDLSQNPIKSDHLTRILHDFPDFKDEKSVRENSDVVLQYYNGLIKNEIKPVIEKALSKKGSGRLKNIFTEIGQVNPLEWQHLNNNPIMISRFFYASTRAKNETIYRYGTNDDGVQANAFKHAVWTCLIIREAMLASYSKNNAIYFTRNITSDHECDSTGARLYNEHTAMDLHNNLSARSWFNAHFGGGVWPFSLNIPSETQVYDFWQDSATNRGYNICNAAVYLPSQFSGWDFLYGEAVSLMHNRLYFIRPIPSGC